MKHILFISIFLLFTTVSTAQVLIGNITAASSNSVSVEFGSEARGVLLEPIDLPTTASAGTIIFDDNSGSLRYYDGSSWSPVTTGGLTNTVSNYTTTGSVIINNDHSAADGIFIIEETDKALVLPVINNGSLQIKNPVAGLLYYDSAIKSVMVYNGNNWLAY